MLLADVLRQAWRVPDRRPTYHWANKGPDGKPPILLPAIYTINARGGFDISRSRQLIEIFDALDDDTVRRVTLLAPPRSGKSMVADIWIPSVLDRDAGPVMWNMQTRAISTRHFLTRVLPIFKSGVLASLLPKRFKQTEVIFTNSIPFCIDGPSIGNLQSIGIRYKINDECWIWPVGRLKEANARVRDFEKLGTSKILTISQGGYENEDLDEEWRDGDQREWNVICTHCGKYQEPLIRGFRPDGSRWGLRFETDGGQAEDEKRPLEDRLGRILASVRFECQHCGQGMLDTERTHAEWNRLGHYVATNPGAKPGLRSFHYPSTICRPWIDIVSDFLKAIQLYKTGSLEGLVVFCQKDEALTWSELRTLRADPMRKEDFDVKATWENEGIRLMEVDCQQVGLKWCTVYAASKPDATGMIEIRLLWFGHLFSEDEVKAKQEEFGIKPFHVAVDCRYEAQSVFAMCCRNGWIAFQGEKDKFFLFNAAPPGEAARWVRRSWTDAKGDPEMGKKRQVTRQGPRYAHVIRWSNPSTNDRLQRILDLGRPRVVLPAGALEPEVEKEYQTQMRAEYPKIIVDKVTGRRKRIWVCPSGNNHARDCTLMMLGQLVVLKILPDETTVEDSRGDAS